MKRAALQARKLTRAIFNLHLKWPAWWWRRRVAFFARVARERDERDGTTRHTERFRKVLSRERPWSTWRAFRWVAGFATMIALGVIPLLLAIVGAVFEKFFEITAPKIEKAVEVIRGNYPDRRAPVDVKFGRADE